MSSLYIYLDESGNFDFSHKGTPFFLLCALITRQPAITQQPLQELKYSLLEDGRDVESFHASEDSQIIRDLVFESITSLNNISFHYAYIDKRKLSDDCRSGELIYGLLSKTLLNHCLSLRQSAKDNRIIVIFDKVFNTPGRNRQKAVVKPILSANKQPYWLYFHRTAYDFNAQLADYGAWALYVKLSRDEVRPLAALQKFQPSILDITP